MKFHKEGKKICFWVSAVVLIIYAAMIFMVQHWTFFHYLFMTILLLFVVALCILVIIGQDSDLVFKGELDWKRTAITYMGIPFFLAFYIYHKIKYKTKLIPLKEVNLDKY